MDWNRVEGNWKQLKGKVKEQWGKLTDDDLDVINGQLERRTFCWNRRGALSFCLRIGLSENRLALFGPML